MPGSARNIVGKILHFPAASFLVAALPAVHFYNLNLGLLQYEDLIKAVLLAWLVVCLALLVGRLIWSNFHAASVVMTPLLAIIFKGHHLGFWWILVLLLISLFLGFVLRRKPGLWPHTLALPLNLALLSLVAMPLAGAWRSAYHDQAPQPDDFFYSEAPLPTLSAHQHRPDIYYILVDGLGQPDFIESEYPLTPAEYSGLFSQRGFQVNHHSFANYPQTSLSAASTMNMAPVQKILKISEPNSQDRRSLSKVVGQSRVVRALRSYGYQVVDLPSGYPMTHQDLAHHTEESFWAPTFIEYYLFDDGILPLVLPLFGLGPADVPFALRRARLNYIFDHLPQVRQKVDPADPVFVYTHLLAPHPPFVFGRQGQSLQSRATFGFADGDHWLDIHGPQDHSYRQRYADQAVWIMKRLAETVDLIMASAGEKIIIIQGDHGPGSELKWENPDQSNLVERFGIFNAWYVSSGQSVPLYQGQTAINTFPILFNSLFDAQMPLLKDQLWFARMSRPFIFLELSPNSLRPID